MHLVKLQALMSVIIYLVCYQFEGYSVTVVVVVNRFSGQLMQFTTKDFALFHVELISTPRLLLLDKSKITLA